MRYSDQEYIDVPLAYLNPSGDIKTTTHMEASFYAFSTVEKVEILLSAAPNKQIFRQHLNLTCCLASNESTDK